MRCCLLIALLVTLGALGSSAQTTITRVWNATSVGYINMYSEELRSSFSLDNVYTFAAYPSSGLKFLRMFNGNTGFRQQTAFLISRGRLLASGPSSTGSTNDKLISLYNFGLIPKFNHMTLANMSGYWPGSGPTPILPSNALLSVGVGFTCTTCVFGGKKTTSCWTPIPNPEQIIVNYSAVAKPGGGQWDTTIGDKIVALNHSLVDVKLSGLLATRWVTFHRIIPGSVLMNAGTFNFSPSCTQYTSFTANSIGTNGVLIGLNCAAANTPAAYSPLAGFSLWFMSLAWGASWFRYFDITSYHVPGWNNVQTSGNVGLVAAIGTTMLFQLTNGTSTSWNFYAIQDTGGSTGRYLWTIPSAASARGLCGTSTHFWILSSNKMIRAYTLAGVLAATYNAGSTLSFVSLSVHALIQSARWRRVHVHYMCFRWEKDHLLLDSNSKP